ncbi:MAG TPA: hypothetical protein VGK33_17490 [Chloroflexota bacterium]|jgi:hypothetical protein
MSRLGKSAPRVAAALALALGCAAGVAASGAPNGCRPSSEGAPGARNQQQIDRPAGDTSLLAQSITPASRGNLQTAATQSPDGSNVIVQSIDGERNVQTARQSGRNNIAVQKQTGSCNRQSIRQSGDGNVAVQSQSGRRLSSVLNQHSDER